EEAGDARILPVTKQTQRGHSEDRPKSAGQNRNQNAERQPNPGAITIPKFLSLFSRALCRSRCDENQERRQSEQNDSGQRQNNSHGMIEGVTESKQPLPCRVVHLKARAIRLNLRRTVMTQPAIIRVRARLMTPTSRLSKWKICHDRGTTTEYRQAMVMTSIRCCLAIGPQNSLGPPAIFPAART